MWCWPCVGFSNSTRMRRYGSSEPHWEDNGVPRERVSGNGDEITYIFGVGQISTFFLGAQLCALCDPMACCLPGSSVCGIFQARTGAGCHFLLQGIFLI